MIQHTLAPKILAMDLGPNVADWAPALADRLFDIWARPPTDRGNRRQLEHTLRFTVFLPLARSGLPIERRWERLLPMRLGPYRAWMHECVAAIAPDRRDRALDEAFVHELGPEEVVALALDLLPTHRSKWLARQILRRARKHRSMTEGEVLGVLEAYAAQLPDLEGLLRAHRAKRKPITLKVIRSHQPASRDDVPPYLHAQLEVAGGRADLFEPDALLRILEIDEARSDRSYTAWLHHVDTGLVLRRRGTEIVAQVLQFGVECEDEVFGDALTAAFRKEGLFP